MVSISSSSSRTVVDHRPEKRILLKDDAESSINLNNLEIPNLNLCNSFDFMNEDLLEDGNEVPPAPPPLVKSTNFSG